MALQVELPIADTRYLLSHSDFIPERGSVLFKDISYKDAFDTVWNSPWRMWEYVPKSKYQKDSRLHVIGHVPVQFISENPEPLAAFVDEEHHIVNIDLGCAGIGLRTGKATGRALCCMNLTAYAEGAGKDAFTYYQ